MQKFSPFYSAFHFRLGPSHYGIIAWGATYSSYLTPLKSLRNRAIKLLSGATRFQSAHLLYKNHNILNLDSLLSQETAKFMYEFIHKQLPVQFDNNFNSVMAINKRSTRASQKKNQLYIPRFRTNRLQRSIKYRGVKLYGTIYLTKLRITTVIY